MTAMTSFKPTICPSVTVREGGSRARDAAGSARAVAAVCAAAALFAAAAAAFAAKLLPLEGFAAASVPEAFAGVPAVMNELLTLIDMLNHMQRAAVHNLSC